MLQWYLLFLAQVEQVTKIKRLRFGGGSNCGDPKLASPAPTSNPNTAATK
jgi:hypothetical protein